MTPDQKRPSTPPLRHKPTAKVAVALKHDRPDVPHIVASGRGAVAERILDIAFASGVAVREDRDLAQLLAAVELDCQIPMACFEAVAEILAYLYRLNGSAGAPPPTPSPAPGASHDAAQSTRQPATGHGS